METAPLKNTDSTFIRKRAGRLISTTGQRRILLCITQKRTRQGSFIIRFHRDLFPVRIRKILIFQRFHKFPVFIKLAGIDVADQFVGAP